jgi:DNA gyrase/topoisomerase IV subunit B
MKRCRSSSKGIGDKLRSLLKTISSLLICSKQEEKQTKTKQINKLHSLNVRRITTTIRSSRGKQKLHNPNGREKSIILEQVKENKKTTQAHEKPEEKSPSRGGRREATPLPVKTRLIGDLSLSLTSKDGGFEFKLLKRLS